MAAAALALALLGAPGSASAQAPPLTATPPPAKAPPGTLLPAPVLAPPGTTPPAADTAPPAPVTAPAAPVVAPKSTSGWKAPAKKPPPPPPLPDTPARLWIIAPGPREAWTMRIDNEGERPIRIPADVRLLSFEVEVWSPDPKKKKPTIYKCAAPDGLRPSGFPDTRGLLLGPGQSYIENFDPRLFCFGKNADALVGSAVVHARFGWSPPPPWIARSQKVPTGPFAAEGADNPAPTTPLRQLTAPTLVLSYGTPPPTAATTLATSTSTAPTTPAANASGESPMPPATPANAPGESPMPPATAAPAATASGESPMASATAAATTTAPSALPPLPAPKLVDANAPRLAVESDRFTDASRPSSAAVTVTVKNAGGRPMTAALRARMVSLQITGPDRTVVCPASPQTRSSPREAYREYKPGAKTSFTLLIQEACPDDVFSRPGLYTVKAGFWASESGSELDLSAFTGRATAEAPTLLRLKSAREPFYREAPKAVPTPKHEIPENDAETSP